MSEYVIMPYDDYKSTCDTIRSASGKTDLIKSGDMSSEIMELIDNPKVSFKLCTLPDIDDSYNCNFVIGNGRLVILRNNCVIYTDDGINWNTSILPISDTWSCITYGNGKFVALNSSFGSAKAIYSDDGINWDLCALPISFSSMNQFCSIVYGNGRFIAFYTYSSDAIYSDDGINWNKCTLPVYRQYTTSAYGNGKFVVLSNNSAIYSTDGINWSSSYNPESIKDNIFYKDGKFIAFNFDNIMYSSDGINWNTSTFPDDVNISTVKYGNGMFVASNESYGDKIIYSDDGINWDVCVIPPNVSNIIGLGYVNGKFIAILYNSKKAIYSDDGINWDVCTLPNYCIDYNIITCCDGKCVIYSYSGSEHKSFYCNLNIKIM